MLAHLRRHIRVYCFRPVELPAKQREQWRFLMANLYAGINTPAINGVDHGSLDSKGFSQD